MNAPKAICVTYRKVGLVHVFTSSDLPGLYHAHADLEAAFNSLIDVVADLVRHQFGEPTHYTVDRDFASFKAELLEADRVPPIFNLTAEKVAA
ncbi:MAG: hypothetical protein ACK5XB_19235 [Rhodospirillales bacterium]|jgi:hypothetical protein